ncbi:MAG: mechanosensitive ion channel protein MscS [Ponticaulis sp.]|nr:mechanosensitive ion channel protein MscS [Ponticaulis sp.]
MENAADINPVELIWGTILGLTKSLLERLPQIALAIIAFIAIILIAGLIAKVVGGLMKKAHTRSALIQLSKNLISIAAWILAVAVAITIIFPSITPASLIAGLGLTTVAIGFAFKDIFENFLAGVIILARKKMEIGDVIELDDVFGRVEDIQIRETHVRDTSGELIIVPNAHLFKNPVEVQTDQKLRRQELVVGVDYDADMREVRTALQGALDTCDTVDTSKGTEVKCVGFGGSSIDFKLLWWADSQPKSQRDTYDQVAFAVKDALDEKGIGIPFPQSTLSFREEAWPVRIANREGRENDARETTGD